MKKLLLIFFLLLGSIPTVLAETKHYKNGQITAYLSGNRVEVVDNDNNMCVVVNVSSHKNSAGQIIYDLACGNKYTKNLTKLALKGAIGTLIVSATSVGGPAGTAAGATISAVATSIAGDAYDDICNYFGDN